MCRRTAVTAIAAAVLGSFSIRTLGTTQQAGTVVALDGQCFAEADGQRRVLRVGDAIYVGETVDVPAGAKLKLRMRDGSVISLASGSRMTIHTFGIDTGGQKRDAKLILRNGLLRAVVSAVSQPSIFEVDCAAGKAEVRSTDWFIETQPASARVGVLEGSVVLTSRATGRSVTIPARWGARLEAGLDPVGARLWTAAEFAEVIARTDVR